MPLYFIAFFCFSFVHVVLAVLVTIGTKFLSSISLPFYHSMYTILVSSLPLPPCFNCVLWNGFDSWKEIDWYPWYPVLFPFFSASFFFFTLLLFHNHCMMVGSNVSITVEPTIAKQGGFPLSQFIPRLKLFVEIP